MEAAAQKALRPNKILVLKDGLTDAQILQFIQQSGGLALLIPRSP